MGGSKLWPLEPQNKKIKTRCLSFFPWLEPRRSNQGINRFETVHKGRNADHIDLHNFKSTHLRYSRTLDVKSNFSKFLSGKGRKTIKTHFLMRNVDHASQDLFPNLDTFDTYQCGGVGANASASCMQCTRRAP